MFSISKNNILSMLVFGDHNSKSDAIEIIVTKLLVQSYISFWEIVVKLWIILIY